MSDTSKSISDVSDMLKDCYSGLDRLVACDVLECKEVSDCLDKLNIKDFHLGNAVIQLNKCSDYIQKGINIFHCELNNLNDICNSMIKSAENKIKYPSIIIQSLTQTIEAFGKYIDDVIIYLNIILKRYIVSCVRIYTQISEVNKSYTTNNKSAPIKLYMFNLFIEYDAVLSEMIKSTDNIKEKVISVKLKLKEKGFVYGV